MNKKELVCEKIRLENQLVDIQRKYAELVTRNKVGGIEAFDLKKQYQDISTRVKALNRRIFLLDSQTKTESIDSRVDDIIELVLEHTLIDGIHDPCGNAELSVFNQKALKQKIKSLIKELI